MGLDENLPSYRSRLPLPPVGYFVLLGYYILACVSLGLGSSLSPAYTAETRQFLLEIGGNAIYRFGLLVGIPVLILMTFNIYLFPLSYHRHNVFSTFFGVIVSSLLGISIAVILIYLFGQTGLKFDEIGFIMNFNQVFPSQGVAYAVGFLIAFFKLAFPEEFFRAVLLSGGLRINNPNTFTFLLLVSSIFYGYSYWQLGWQIGIMSGVFGLALGTYYALRQSFWELVFLHTMVVWAIILLPRYNLPML